MSDDVYLAALGRLDATKKAAFLRDAKAIMRFNEAHISTRQLTRVDYDLLESFAVTAKKLHRLFVRAERLGLPASLIRHAWKQQTAPYDLDLVETIWCISQCGLWFIGKHKRPAHRPDATWSHNGIKLTFITMAYWQRFGRRPTLGNGTPFVRFCRLLLHDNPPSLDTLTKIVNRTLPDAKK